MESSRFTNIFLLLAASANFELSYHCSKPTVIHDTCTGVYRFKNLLCVAVHLPRSTVKKHP